MLGSTDLVQAIQSLEGGIVVRTLVLEQEDGGLVVRTLVPELVVRTLVLEREEGGLVVRTLVPVQDQTLGQSLRLAVRTYLDCILQSCSEDCNYSLVADLVGRTGVGWSR